MKIGENIRRRRNALKMTLETLALAIDWDTGNLSRLERGAQDTSEDRLQKIAQALGCAVLDFYTGESGSNIVSAPVGARRIPLITYVQAGTWTAISEDPSRGIGQNLS